MIHKTTKIVLFLGDIIILYFSLYLALLVRYGIDFHSDIWKIHFSPFSFTFALWMLIFYIAGLYEQNKAKNNYQFYWLLAKTVLICTTVAVMIFYLIPSFGITPKINLALTVSIFFVLFVLWRRVYNEVLANHFLHHIIFIGLNKETKDIIDHITTNPQMGYITKAVMEYSDIKDLRQMVIKENIDIVIYAKEENTENSQYISRALYDLIPLHIQILDFSKFYSLITNKIPVSIVGETWFLENLIAIGQGGYNTAKRALDICTSIVLGVLFLPFAPLLALLIISDSKGGVLYTQKRVGKNGKIFRLIKFRTMIKNAENKGAQWTKEKDARVTRIGNILRKSRIDELPQLLNVLRGDMSFIGPRPERPEFIHTLEKEIPHYHMRHLVKPGLTGWAQIHEPLRGASVIDSTKKLQYDLYYIQNIGPVIDLAILLKTIRVVLSREGR